jgi:hypothetical protein
MMEDKIDISKIKPNSLVEILLKEDFRLKVDRNADGSPCTFSVYDTTKRKTSGPEKGAADMGNYKDRIIGQYLSCGSENNRLHLTVLMYPGFYGTVNLDEARMISFYKAGQEFSFE